MSWRAEPPTISGLYFHREDVDDDYAVYTVFVSTGASCVWVSKNASVGFDDMGGQWWSERIQEPGK